MPVIDVVSPAAAVPADRLTLDANPVRSSGSDCSASFSCYPGQSMCMADE